MNGNRGFAIIFGIAFAALLVKASAYRLMEWEQAIITRFGKPVGSAITESGLHFRVPFIDKVRRLDKRILNWDGTPDNITTGDKTIIIVDTTARWKIVDPLLFIETIGSIRDSAERIEPVLESATRDVISKYKLVEAVRNTNDIIQKVAKKRELAAKGLLPPDEQEVVGEIPKIEFGREHLSEKIIEAARAELKAFGIEIIDVQIRRIAYEPSVEKDVFTRATWISSVIEIKRSHMMPRLTGSSDLDTLPIVSSLPDLGHQVVAGIDPYAIPCPDHAGGFVFFHYRRPFQNGSLLHGVAVVDRAFLMPTRLGDIDPATSFQRLDPLPTPAGKIPPSHTGQ